MKRKFARGKAEELTDQLWSEIMKAPEGMDVLRAVVFELSCRKVDCTETEWLDAGEEDLTRYVDVMIEVAWKRGYADALRTITLGDLAFVDLGRN